MSSFMFCFCIALIASIPCAIGSSLVAATIGLIYDQGLVVARNPTVAVLWYRKAALEGGKSGAEAAFILGTKYQTGQDVPRDFEQAAYWWLRSASTGYPAAEDAMGDAYCVGMGLRFDPARARYWWQLAARQNNERAREHARQMLSERCTGRPNVPLRLEPGV